MIFLDTNAALDLLNKNPSIRKIIKKEPDSIAITSVTMFEIYCGIDYFKEKGWKREK